MTKLTAMIRSIRAYYNETQADTAAAIGISTNAYALRENGERDFLRKELYRWKKHFNMTDEEFCRTFFSDEVNANETESDNPISA